MYEVKEKYQQEFKGTVIKALKYPLCPLFQRKIFFFIF